MALVFLAAMVLAQSSAKGEHFELDFPASIAREGELAAIEARKFEGALAQLLPKGDAGFARIRLVPGSHGPGATLSIGAHYDGFPKKRYAFDQALAQLMLRGWNFDGNDPIWGDGLEWYVANQALRKTAYPDDAFYAVRDLASVAKRSDPRLDQIDLAKADGIDPAVRLGKGVWLLNQLQVRYPPSWLHIYLNFRKRATAEQRRDPSQIALLASLAAGIDQSKWFQRHGLSVKTIADPSLMPEHGAKIQVTPGVKP